MLNACAVEKNYIGKNKFFVLHNLEYALVQQCLLENSVKLQKFFFLSLQIINNNPLDLIDYVTDE